MLSDHIASVWGDIVNVYRLSKCSGARPRFLHSPAIGRAIETSNISVKRISQRHLASAYPMILNLDINRFYGSIYTHSIPWAALGKEAAKNLHKTKTLSSHWSDKLDKLVRNCNQQQTIGIPIGPDTSRIISELILSRIDHEITSASAKISAEQVYHNIDDYQFGVNNLSEAEIAETKFVRSIARYELRLNDFKRSVKSGLDFAPSNFQRSFDILGSQSGDRFVEHFFDVLYNVSKDNPDANVVGYALKRFGKLLASNTSRDLVREYVQRLVFAAPYHARWAFPILLGICRQTTTKMEVKRLVRWGIETCARRNDVGSLLWFLYAALFLGIKIDASACRQCIDVSSELVDVMLVHGRNSKIFDVDIKSIRDRYEFSDFSSSGWLPLYEIERRNWDNSPSFKKIGTSSDPNSLYEKLNTNNVEFYITSQDAFEVSAFEGWKLNQHDFDHDKEHEDADFDWIAQDNNENYG